ncbi:hypothetical protein BCR36DRAFT_277503 [Piromyces finnis]|uniref:Uncharacterized protein n=1 Tax=Piromyces finnis TaxID=1754191 RepID=A0A1Y1VJ42_9FUNG|nr:hypothetical protein BCR36DRAFT_277503 [Piromyces finnis]|eukprot:ORX57729.1 hypothetical protein BCR36DRAFT_277503 [Piromyces finnis]
MSLFSVNKKVYIKRKNSMKIDNIISPSFKESLSEFYTPNIIQESIQQKEFLNDINNYKTEFNWTINKYIKSFSGLKLNKTQKALKNQAYESISEMLNELETLSDFISFINNITISINNIKNMTNIKNEFLIKNLVYELEQIMDIAKLLFKQYHPGSNSNLINNEITKYSCHIVNDDIQNLIKKVLDEYQNYTSSTISDIDSHYNPVNNLITNKQNNSNDYESLQKQYNENNNENSIDEITKKFVFEKKQFEIMKYIKILKDNNIIIENMDKFKCNQVLSRAPLPVNSFTNIYSSE